MLGIDFVPGVELTTMHTGRVVHMLGYFVDAANESLLAFMAENRLRRQMRVCAMADRLAQDGYSVSSQELDAEVKAINRTLLAGLLVRRGHADSIDDAFSRFLGSSAPYYVDVTYPDTIEAMRLVSGAGGYAFVAHPARSGIADLIGMLAREGMTGLEAYHSAQTPSQSCELVRLASDLGLAVSGGSDWHGIQGSDVGLGSCGLDESEYRAFLNACGRI